MVSLIKLTLKNNFSLNITVYASLNDDFKLLVYHCIVRKRLAKTGDQSNWDIKDEGTSISISRQRQSATHYLYIFQ